jgi:DNA polymerase-3 subunit gamma/tau
MLNAVASGTEGHAYLFSGPRGTGKTSTARILAKALNCEDLRDGEPCCECDSCRAIEAGSSLDLFELDAASNNKVDDMRSLIGGTVVSSPGRTKVYILDEVHMLSAGASNALLKTLEEPPSGVCFVLATTDPNKVLPTIRSRTQHFEFRLLSAAELESYVRWIAEDAGLDLTDEAVAHVVRVGRGSARDTLSALDQVVAAGGVASRSEPVDDLVDALAGADAGAAVQAVAAALAEGHDPRVLAEAVLSVLRDAFLCSVGVEVPQLLDADRAQAERWAGELGTRRLTRALERIGTALVDMRHAADARVPLEVALVSLTSDQDRLAELERRVAELEEGGVRSAPAARRSAASAAAVAGSGAVADSAPAADDGAVGEANDRGSVPAAASEDPPRTGSSPAPGGAAARAAQARAALDASAAGRRGSGGATGPPPTRPAARPAAPRRPGSGESSNPVAGADVAASAPGSERTVEVPDSAPEQPSGAPAAGADVDPAADGAVSPEPRSAAAPSTAVPSTGAPLADEWVRASLADNVLPSLKGRARALVAQAAVERVEGSTVLLGVANEATMARAEEFVPQVADLLSAAAGRPVEVALVVAGSPVAATRGAEPLPERAPMEDSGSTDDAVRAGAAPPGGENPSSTEDELVDLDELEDASDVATTGVARLTQAFPGAVVVDSEGTT